MPLFCNDTKPKQTELPNIVSPLDQIPSYYNLADKPWCYDDTSSSDLGNFYVDNGFFNQGNPAKNYRDDSSINNLLKK